MMKALTKWLMRHEILKLESRIRRLEWAADELKIREELEHMASRHYIVTTQRAMNKWAKQVTEQLSQPSQWVR